MAVKAFTVFTLDFMISLLLYVKAINLFVVNIALVATFVSFIRTITISNAFIVWVATIFVMSIVGLGYACS